MKEIRRRTKVVGAFPDGNSGFILEAARLGHMASRTHGTEDYLNRKLSADLEKSREDQATSR